MQHKRSAERIVAMFVLVGFVDIPIIHYSVYWWNTLHQGATLTLFAPSAIDSTMLWPLLASIVAFLIYYALVLFIRMRHELIVIEEKPHWLRNTP
jgi:heme exporter protein C